MIHANGQDVLTYITKLSPDDIQPNAVDVRLDKVFRHMGGQFELYEDGTKVHRQTKEITPSDTNCFYLPPGSYEFICENEVEMGPEEAGFILSRSTLIRNGCNIITGLYDAGYKGLIGGQLNIQSGWAKIQRGARIGQFIIFKAETLHQYDGDYGNEKEHDQKYKG